VKNNLMAFEILYPENFPSYELLDSGDGERLERFGDIVIRKPDPQCLWSHSLGLAEWNRADAQFERRNDGDKGEWFFKNRFPSRWELSWDDIKFYVQPTPFKHLGVFPEQAVHWRWMKSKLGGSNKKNKVLNLFGYTGLSSVVCSESGAAVTQVDASKPAITWAKENMILSGLPDDSIRWILDDVLSFVKREVRRGSTYDAIIMDPPVFGHGAKGEVWKFHEHFPELMKDCVSLLSPNPLFLIVNAYAVSASAIMLQNVLEDAMRNFKGQISCGELALQQKNGRILSTGIFGRWEALQ